MRLSYDLAMLFLPSSASNIESSPREICLLRYSKKPSPSSKPRSSAPPMTPPTTGPMILWLEFWVSNLEDDEDREVEGDGDVAEVRVE